MSSKTWLARSFKTRSGLAQWALLIAAVGFIVWIVVSRGGDLKAAFHLTPRIFIFITLASFGTFALNGIELQVLAAIFKRKIPFGEGMLLGLMVSTLNYLPMKTGTMLNGVLMKARYKLSLSHFTALVAGSSVVHLWVCFLLAGFALIISGPTYLMLGLLFLLGPTAGVAGVMIWGRMRTAGKHEGHENRFVRVAARAVDGIGEMFTSGRLLAIDIAINVGLVLLWAVRSYWSFQSIGIQASFGEVMTVTALGIVATRLSVIPGGVGFREAGAALGSKLTGLPAGAGFAASVIDRAVMLIWLLVLGVPATLFFFKLTGIGLDDAFRGAKGEPIGEADGAQ